MKTVLCWLVLWSTSQQFVQIHQKNVSLIKYVQPIWFSVSAYEQVQGLGGGEW